MKTTWLCECESLQCVSRVEIELELAEKLQQNNEVVIVDGCEIGPSKGDVLVEIRKGYSVYKPVK